MKNEQKIKMNKLQYKLYTPYDQVTSIQMGEVTDFLYKHLQEFGDKKADIKRALVYAMKDKPHNGGFVLVGIKDKEIMGVVVVNQTGMEGYIPENILVYIAVHKNTRGQGIGKQLMKRAIKCCNGDIALHVEPDNPALFLYQGLGFENKYLEMRLQKAGISRDTVPPSKEGNHPSTNFN